MRTYSWLVAVMVVSTLLGSCGGGGGGGGSSVNSTPSISNLTFTPSAALQNDGNGSVTVTGTATFVDAGGDVAMLHLSNPAGQTIDTAITGAAGQTSGTIQAVAIVSTQTVGHYAFSIYVTDSGGRRSNSLTGTFDVNPNSTAAHWSTQSLPVPSGSMIMLKRVRWSGSVLVAVGGSIFTSQDAVAWTERPVGVISTLLDVAWTGSQFVAVGDFNGVLTSPDGSAWTTQVVPSGVVPVLAGVAASGSRIVAVGRKMLQGQIPAAGVILTSPDGVTWTEAPMPSSASLNAIAWSGSQFVAVGTLDNQPSLTPVAMTSPDGLTWTSHLMGISLLPADIVWNGSRFVVVGGGAATSADGIAWQETGAGVVVAAYAVAWSGQGFLACGTTYCYSSTDGSLWAAGGQLPSAGDTVYGLAWGGSKWVAVGADSLALTSP